MRSPRVFSSYSHDSADHADRVLDLADRLSGIDAGIDQYNLSPPEGWSLRCERQIVRTGWCRQVQGQEPRQLDAAGSPCRAGGYASEVANKIRGALKNFGLVLGKVAAGAFETRVH